LIIRNLKEFLMEETKATTWEHDPVKTKVKPTESFEESKESMHSQPKPTPSGPINTKSPKATEISESPPDSPIVDLELECVVSSFLQLPEEFLRKAMMHSKFGVFLLKSGKFDKAIRQFLDAKMMISDLPIYTDLFQNLGNCYSRQKKPHLAEKYYMAVVKYSPHSHSFPHETLNFLDVESRSKFIDTLNTREAFEDAQKNLELTYNSLDGKKEINDSKTKKKEEPQSFSSKIEYGVSLREVA
jgi:tetratricopeptide (TPR) repeat protein